MLVDAGRGEPVRRLRGQQQMVDTDAVVFLPCASLIIPERIEVRVVAHRADRIGQAEIGQRPKARAGLRQEQRIVDPEFRVVGVGRDGITL